MEDDRKTTSAFWMLRAGLGGTAFLAGADKFTNLLTDWEKYIAPEASEKLPVSNKTFMRLVGIVEMAVGIGILSPYTRVSSYAAAAWLTCIAGNLVLNGDYDIAVRDLNMALGAVVLGQLSPPEQKRVENGETRANVGLTAA
jgi:uncharacterized membrane protein YphA (DoxX/SURF4 family)